MKKDYKFNKVAKALADPNRFKILERIAQRDEVSCSEITRLFKLSQPTVSHHLKTLSEAGLIIVRREGQFGYFKADKKVIEKYIEELGERITGRKEGKKHDLDN
ncbi:MAG: hypothetical protein Kow0090_03980 [Myxococcota bacterium]